MKGERELVITIDGPAGAGKSTAARLLAARLGYRLIDTGAMYRALALAVDRAALPPEDTPELRRLLDGVHVELRGEQVLLNGEDVSGRIRTPRISDLTSRLTMLEPIRTKVTPLQRAMARAGGVVLEGRDTGTVVCPDADVKFYLDAGQEERARRRQAELAARGILVDLAVVHAEIGARDVQDKTRALAPLRKAPDAVEIDTGGLTPGEVVERMMREIERRCCTRS
ncbi:MAG TPA: (d)CMP kinase [Candidatus Binatia bacterium]|nr:(d)CMP kinase [Candidatus Binatia bacterium]